jgi:cyclic pyranopterin phosphate synthase
MSKVSEMKTPETGMVDVSRKDVTRREAKARGFVRLTPVALEHIRRRKVQKGDVIAMARVAGIMAAKRTADIVPLCHPISLTYIGLSPRVTSGGVEILATVRARERTGVEMEALAAVAGAALTVYDMCKSLDRGAVISDICLLEKSGGRSGRYIRRGR